MNKEFGSRLPDSWNPVDCLFEASDSRLPLFCTLPVTTNITYVSLARRLARGNSCRLSSLPTGINPTVRMCRLVLMPHAAVDALNKGALRPSSMTYLATPRSTDYPGSSLAN
jgi:hypothetical protein